MKFRIIKGSYYENHRMYREGEIFQSEKNLAKAFPGEIVEVKESAPAFMPPTLSEKKEDNKTSPTAIINDDPLKSPSTTEVPEKTKKVLKKKLNGPTNDERGELLNSRFDFDPKKTGVDVFRRGGKYFVYSHKNPEKAINKSGIAREEVMDFIKTHHKD